MGKLKTIILISLMTFKVYGQDTLSMNMLIDAMIQVESKGDSTAIGDGGKAVGVLQIHPIMVREVNRILKKDSSEMRYEYKDRYSVSKSIEMFHIWRVFYHKDSSFEKIARCWNGGTRGHLMYRTKYYWRKVKEQWKN